MRRGVRIIGIFVAAVLVPAAALAALALRAARMEDLIRGAEAHQRLRGFLDVARRDFQHDLQARLEEERARLERALVAGERIPELLVTDVPAEPPPLETAVARERPDLAGMLDEAEVQEFQRDRPAAAVGLYLSLAESLEQDTTRARLLAAAARCAVKANDVTRARPLLEQLIREHGDTRTESLLPIGVTARLQLWTLARDDEERGRLMEELLETNLDPVSELMLLSRIGGPNLEARVERARIRWDVLEWASKNEDHAWFSGPGGLWLALRVGPSVFVVPAGEAIRGETRSRLEELARLGSLRFGFKLGDTWLSEPLPDSEMEASPAGPLRIAAQSIDPNRPRGLSALLGGLVFFLIVAMAIGFAMTWRAVQREVRLARLKSDFISNVSHEVRTPLTSVRMYSDLLAHPAVESAEKRREYASVLHEEASRLSRLVERLLDFSRLERGKRAYSFEERDLAEVVQGAVRSFRSPRPEFRFSVSLPSAPVRARVDGGAIEQVVHNLLDNAVKYSPNRDEADVVLRAENAHAVLEVRDRGAGIDRQDLPVIFETFTRGRGPLRAETPGAGLGLAIVRQIVEAHRGRVRVESDPGAGSSFFIELPLCPQS
ncbi:MAG: HAMP domain-containing histidine kinase [Planctomycetes bacterium]|nr:HAMP domain-containing histidine kinase [Planctomycetota bacterium]